MSMFMSSEHPLAKTWMFQAEVARLIREAKMPTEAAAIAQMNEAITRLEELGWRNWIYMPKGGETVMLIEPRSSGVMTGAYVGEWPTGGVFGGGDHFDDFGPVHPVLFKQIPEGGAA